MKKIAMILLAMGIAATAQATNCHDPADGHGHGEHAKPGDSAFHGVMGHYEAIRLALLEDHMHGVAEHAKMLREKAEHLRGAFDAERAGIDSAEAADCKSLLPKIEEAARKLQKTKTLEAARRSFYELSKPMVLWREMAEGEHRPVVVYCSMAKKSWLQPAGEIGNPYYGQSMARCGEVVSR